MVGYHNIVQARMAYAMSHRQQLGSRQELSTAGACMQRIHYMQHPVVQNEDIDVEATARMEMMRTVSN